MLRLPHSCFYAFQVLLQFPCAAALLGLQSPGGSLVAAVVSLLACWVSAKGRIVLHLGGLECRN